MDDRPEVTLAVHDEPGFPMCENCGKMCKRPTGELYVGLIFRRPNGRSRYLCFDCFEARLFGKAV